jgi:nucleotide-binding universal stress UspA family protein
MPVVQAVRDRGILRDFPDRTEADLYLWIADHRAALEDELGWEIEPVAAAADLSWRFSPRLQRIIQRVRDKLLDAITPDELEAGPEPGRWRRERVEARHYASLFPDILVAVNGEDSGWHTLDQALVVAKRDGAHLHGLYVVASAAGKAGANAQSIEAEFARRCQAAGVPGRLAVEVGEVARQVSERAIWTDLVVLSLNYPPGSRLLARLSSGLSTIIRRCSRPILAVPMSESCLSRALLAYDGSPKAEEALFVSTYLAGCWHIPLTVVAVAETGEREAQALERAQCYLSQRGIQAAYELKTGRVSEAILSAADEHESDLIIMGGYGPSPVMEVVLGSTVDQVLRAGGRPLLICR